MKGRNILVAIFAEADSIAAHTLQEAGVTRFDVVNYISHGVSKAGEKAGEQGEGGRRSSVGGEEEESEGGCKQPDRPNCILGRLSMLPPSVLPDISPSRGEIGRPFCFRKSATLKNRVRR